MHTVILFPARHIVDNLCCKLNSHEWKVVSTWWGALHCPYCLTASGSGLEFSHLECSSLQLSHQNCLVYNFLVQKRHTNFLSPIVLNCSIKTSGIRRNSFSMFNEIQGLFHFISYVGELWTYLKFKSWSMVFINQVLVLAGHASGCWCSEVGAGVPYNRNPPKSWHFLYYRPELL